MEDICNFTKDQVEKWIDKDIKSSFYELAKDSYTKDELNAILDNGKIGDKFLKSHYHCVDSPKIEAERRISMAYLLINDRDTYEYLKENHINIFHGTNANAIPGIAKYGLRSASKIKEANEKILSGEASTRINGERNFISVTDVLEVAWDYMQIDTRAFPIIVGTTEEEMRKNDVWTCNVDSDVSEIGIENQLPLKAIKCVMVPKDKVGYVKTLFSNTNINVLGISNINERYFWLDPFLGYQFVNEKYEAYKENKRTEPIYKISNKELIQNACLRVKSKMQKMYNWITMVKEREEVKNDSKRL